MFFKKRWLVAPIFAFANVAQAEEVKPFKYTEASNSYNYRGLCCTNLSVKAFSAI